MAKKKQNTAGANRAAARQVNKEARARISAMTNQQLKGFFAGFGEDLARIEQAIARVRDDQKDALIKKIDEEMEALANKKKELLGK